MIVDEKTELVHGSDDIENKPISQSESTATSMVKRPASKTRL